VIALARWRKIVAGACVIRTITVEREFGAGGAAIAQQLAERLGWKLWDQNLTAEIAKLAQVDQASVERLDERCDSLFYRLMKVYMRGSFERSLPVEGLSHFDADSMVAFMQRVIDRAAAEGNSVIVGRGSTFLLRHREDAFHVFIYAPLDEKIRRVKALGKSESEAIELISEIDHERSTFIQRYYSKEWPTRHLYHLMINSKVGDEVVVRTILDEVHDLDARSATEPVRQGAR
jgi:cytidylate kinase